MYTKEQLHKELKNIVIVTDACELCNTLSINMELFKINKRDYRVSAGGELFVETAMFAGSNKNETTTIKYEPTISVKEFLRIHSLDVEVLSKCIKELQSEGLMYHLPYLVDANTQHLFIPDLSSKYTGFRIANTNLLCYCSNDGVIIFVNDTKFNPEGLKLNVDNLSEYTHDEVFTALYNYMSQRFKYANKLYFIGVDGSVRDKIFDKIKSKCKDGRQIRVTKDLNRYLLTYTDTDVDNLKSAGVGAAVQRKEHWKQTSN